MKQLILLLIMLALPFGLKSEELRPSITFDLNIGMDNSDFKQGPTWPSISDFDYGYDRVGFLLEFPVTKRSIMFRLGLERISHSFDIQKRVKHAGMFEYGLSYATYNIRLGAQFYLDGK